MLEYEPGREVGQRVDLDDGDIQFSQGDEAREGRQVAPLEEDGVDRLSRELGAAASNLRRSALCGTWNGPYRPRVQLYRNC